MIFDEKVFYLVGRLGTSVSSGVLMQQGYIKISNISSFWTVVVSAALFAIVGFKNKKDWQFNYMG